MCLRCGYDATAMSRTRTLGIHSEVSAQCHSTDRQIKHNYDMSLYFQSIVPPLHFSRFTFVAWQRRFESLPLESHNHHKSESTWVILVKKNTIYTWMILCLLYFHFSMKSFNSSFNSFKCMIWLILSYGIDFNQYKGEWSVTFIAVVTISS